MCSPEDHLRIFYDDPRTTRPTVHSTCPVCLFTETHHGIHLWKLRIGIHLNVTRPRWPSHLFCRFSSLYHLAPAIDTTIFSALPAVTSFRCRHLCNIACRASERPRTLKPAAKKTKPHDNMNPVFSLPWSKGSCLIFHFHADLHTNPRKLTHLIDPPNPLFESMLSEFLASHYSDVSLPGVSSTSALLGMLGLGRSPIALKPPIACTVAGGTAQFRGRGQEDYTSGQRDSNTDPECFPEGPSSPSHSIRAILAPQLLLFEAYRLLLSCNLPLAKRNIERTKESCSHVMHVMHIIVRIILPSHPALLVLEYVILQLSKRICLRNVLLDVALPFLPDNSPVAMLCRVC